MRQDSPVTSAADDDHRTYFRTLDAAMADFALPLGAVDKVRDVTRHYQYEHVFIPASRDYIALEALGVAKPVAYITELYIALHPAGGASEWIEVPATLGAAGESDSNEWGLDLPMGDAARDLDPSGAYSTGVTATATLERTAPATRTAPSKSTRAPELVVVTCDSCFTNLPATGVCDYCG